MKPDATVKKIMTERFGHDSLLSVATTDEHGVPFVRTVDSYYEDGAFYTVTYALSKKILHISNNPVVAVCGEWFSGHGIGENLGWVRKKENAEIMGKLHTAFAAWYDNGHNDEDDENTCVLKIKLTDAILFGEGQRFDVDFTEDK